MFVFIYKSVLNGLGSGQVAIYINPWMPVINACFNMCVGRSRKAYPTGIVTKPGLKNNHLAILRATIEPEHQVVTFINILMHT
jgi:hypothetical protein